MKRLGIGLTDIHEVHRQTDRRLKDPIEAGSVLGVNGEFTDIYNTEYCMMATMAAVAAAADATMYLFFSEKSPFFSEPFF